MQMPDTLIKSSRFVVRFALVINRVFLSAVLLGMLMSSLFPKQFVTLLVHNDPAPGTLAGLRWEMLLGVAMSVAIDRLLVTLAQIIATAGAGDPFISDNARRLQTIGWALVALQCLDIPAVMIERFFPSLASGLPSIPFSPGGWLAVLMVFVLSRVFAVGSAMRDDLEGTV